MIDPIEPTHHKPTTDIALDSSTVTATAALTEAQYDGVRDLIRRAYEQGALDVHNHWQQGRDPDFKEMAYNYTTSVTYEFLRLFPSGHILSSPCPSDKSVSRVRLRPSDTEENAKV